MVVPARALRNPFDEEIFFEKTLDKAKMPLTLRVRGKTPESQPHHKVDFRGLPW